MAFSLTQFQNATGTAPLSALDNNFTTISAAAPISCSISGTNALTLTPNAIGLVPSSTLSAYTQNTLFSGVAASTNTGTATATVGSLGALSIYKDSLSGPVVLSGNEIVALNAISLRYDSALNSGAGGFHLTSSTANSNTASNPSSLQIGSGGTLTNLLSGNSPTLTFTVTPGWSSNDVTFTLTGLPPSIPAPGDFFDINPPSLAAAGVSYWAMCTAIGSLSSVASVATVNVRLVNAASASLASNSGIYRWKAERTIP